jgi:uncharacterized repeat protein (TIGR03943 family)
MIIFKSGPGIREGEKSALRLFLLPPFVLAVWGGVFLDLAISGRLRWYLNPLFWPVEIAAGITLMALAGAYLACFRPLSVGALPHSPSRILLQAVFLAIPIVIASTFAPQSFSGAALERRAALSGSRMVAQSASPKTAGDHIEIVDLAAAAYYPEHIPEVTGKQVSYVGQYFPGKAGEFRFCRVLMSCCAQDATPIYVHVVGDAPVFQEMQWIEIQGETFFRKNDGDWEPCVRLQKVTPSQPPADPYLYPVKTGK